MLGGRLQGRSHTNPLFLSCTLCHGLWFAGVGVVQDPGKLYSSMHKYLSSSGVDGVKVDCQAGVGLVGSALGGGAALSRR
jgi:hypothetical protein